MKKSSLTRKDLAKAINEKMGFSQRCAGELIDAFFSCMKEALLKEDSIKIVQFGTLAVRQKAPRQGRNPRTGAALEICRRSMVTFKPSKGLREKLNGVRQGR